MQDKWPKGRIGLVTEKRVFDHFGTFWQTPWSDSLQSLGQIVSDMARQSARPSEQFHHRNGITQTCSSERRYKLWTDVVVVVVARQTTDRPLLPLSRMRRTNYARDVGLHYTDGVQRVRSAIFSQCGFLYQ